MVAQKDLRPPPHTTQQDNGATANSALNNSTWPNWRTGFMIPMN